MAAPQNAPISDATRARTPDRTASPPGRARYDLYTSFHKLLRARLFEASMRLARADFDPPAGSDPDASTEAGESERLAALEYVAATLDLLLDHAEKEDRHVQRILLAYAGPLALSLEREHASLDAEIAALKRLVADAAVPGGAERARRGAELCSRLDLFVAAQLLHLAREEREANAELWAHLSDRELSEIHRRIVESDPPARTAWLLEQLLVVWSPPERARMWASLGKGAPPAARAMTRAIGERVLGAAGWAAVERRAGS